MTQRLIENETEDGELEYSQEKKNKHYSEGKKWKPLLFVNKWNRSY